MVGRFLKTASACQVVISGKPPTVDENIQGANDFLTGTQDLREGHIAWGRAYVLFNVGSFFFRKYVKFKPYKPHIPQNLSPVNVESRLEAC